jgi:hypothetical protein
MKVKDIIAPNELDVRGKPIGKLPCVYDKANTNIGASTEVEIATVEVKDGEGNIFGRRSIVQKK